jgi:hypothetical protein
VIRITPAQPWEAHYVASYLRPEDEQECLAASGKTPQQALTEAFKLSKQVYSIRPQQGLMVELNPVALFGVCDYPAMPQWGLVWLLGTTSLSRVSRSIMLEAPHWLDLMGKGFQCGLHTLSDSRNALHQRWLLRNRFESLGTLDHDGVPFIYYQRPNVGVNSV